MRQENQSSLCELFNSYNHLVVVNCDYHSIFSVINEHDSSVRIFTLHSNHGPVLSISSSESEYCKEHMLHISDSAFPLSELLKIDETLSISIVAINDSQLSLRFYSTQKYTVLMPCYATGGVIRFDHDLMNSQRSAQHEQ